jgi:UDP-N-acetylmuramoyl-L-alanyl-D-glutamate--2,6-diaminopimelate ligase
MAEVSLGELMRRLPVDWAEPRRAPETAPDATMVTGIAEDSRRVAPGTLFVARGGRGVDGHRYIGRALAAGAVGIVGERAPEALPEPLSADVPYWQVRDGRYAFALLSAAFYDYPSRKLIVFGVTGTDGKTTTSTLLQSILTAAGISAGLITTIAAFIGGEALDTGFHVTTPEAFDLQSYLAHMVDAGCRAAVVESTSHALDQQRVAQVDFDVAVVTNITHEHLDWHGSYEAYLAAKARLFQALATAARKPGVPKTAVLNRDDSSYAPLLEVTVADQIFTYAASGDAAATCTASDIDFSREGTAFMLHTPRGAAPVRLRLLGTYNVANALAAASAALALEIPLSAIVAGLEAVEQVRGRMEWVYRGEFDVIVDFGHTPNALAQTLTLARGLVRPGGRVIAVFGSAGLRDVAKRRMMGEVAVAGSDLAVLTAEDPRTEDVHAIIAEIAAGFDAHGAREGSAYLRVPDRAEAIATAIALARPGDLIVTCGKAHEQTMCYGTTETPWDEFAAVRAGLAARGLGA